MLARGPLVLSLVSLAAVPSAALGAEYYVDADLGLDSNPGTSQAQAWRTLAPVNAATFAAGDVIAFRRGGVWTEGLQVRQSGQEGASITFTAWGVGEAPIFEAPAGDPWANAIRIDGKAWIVVDGLAVRNVRATGIAVWGDSSHVLVRDCEATDVGTGVEVGGSNNRVTGCTFHDLHMVVNTEGGDDDYGAIGVIVGGTGHEIDHNRFERCIAPSYDYGTDGGAVEFWRSSSNIRVHHNVAVDTNGFAEIGGLSGDVVADNVLAYNLAVDTHGFNWCHMGGTFGVTLSGLRIENNTIVDSTNNWTIFGFSGTPTAATAAIRNNVAVTNGSRISNVSGFTHDHNRFHLIGGGEVGFPLGTGESAGDPLFAGSGGYQLAAGSPAIDVGADLGWTEDLDGRAVPQGSAPELGAYEWGVFPADAGLTIDSAADADGSAVATDAAVAGDAADAAIAGGAGDAAAAVDATGGKDGAPAMGDGIGGSCGCRTASPGECSWPAVVLTFLALRRRRRSRRR